MSVATLGPGMAKKKRKVEARSEVFVFRCTPAFAAWVRKEADARRFTPSQFFEACAVAFARENKLGEPPRR